MQAFHVRCFVSAILIGSALACSNSSDSPDLQTFDNRETRGFSSSTDSSRENVGAGGALSTTSSGDRFGEETMALFEAMEQYPTFGTPARRLPSDNTYQIFRDVVRGLAHAQKAGDTIGAAKEMFGGEETLHIMTAHAMAQKQFREARVLTMGHVGDVRGNSLRLNDPRKAAQEFTNIYQALELIMQRSVEHLGNAITIPLVQSPEQLQAWAVEAATLGADIKTAWELVPLATAMATFSLLDGDRCSTNVSEPCRNLILLSSERRELIELVEGEFGPGIRQEATSSHSVVTFSAFKLWEFLNRSNWKFVDQ